MMKKIILFVSLIAFMNLSNSCYNNNSKNQNHTSNVDESSDEIDFFPINSGEEVGDKLTIDSSAFHNTTKIQLERKISSKEFNRIKSLKYLLKVLPNDSCIVVINEFLNSSNFNTKLLAQKSSVNKSCSQRKIPMPNFWDIQNPVDVTKMHLNMECEIYILKLEIGLLSSKIESVKSSMPDNIKHGKIGGIVLNVKDSSAIYFLQYW